MWWSVEICSLFVIRYQRMRLIHFVTEKRSLYETGDRKLHKALFHAGVSRKSAKLGNKFWVPAGRSVVFKIIRDCMVCIKNDGGLFKAPPMLPLPTDRVSEFTYDRAWLFGWPTLFDDDAIQTVLTDDVLIPRPLAYVGSTFEDRQIIKPAHF